MIALRQTSFGSTHHGRPSFIQGVATLLTEWQERRRQRQALLALTPELLKDIGLDPGEAWHEGTKPFWKA